MPAKRTTRTRRKEAITVRAWQDDPMGLPAITLPAPDPARTPLRFRIKGAMPPPDVYDPGTAGFRYWTTAEALRRGADFWAPVLGIERWQPGATLAVALDAGDDLNAYYDRSELAFFHSDVKGKRIWSGESPDVACHELGHACLDAHQPRLWDAPFIEAGAFHESFGDMSALSSALQLPSVRTVALPAVRAHQGSVLSRLAEQLGWGVRQLDRRAADPDCLRNAWNAFRYVDPETLPDAAPAIRLCAEVHSFSRVFTGAFYELLSAMLRLRSAKPTSALLLEVATDAARLLADATAAAPVQPDYYAQVATHMIDADTTRFGGRYRAALTGVFVKREIVPAEVVRPLTRYRGRIGRDAFGIAVLAPESAKTVAGRPRTHTVTLRAREAGLGAGRLLVEAPLEGRSFLMASVSLMQRHSDRTLRVERATRRFVRMLVAQRRIDPGAAARAARKPDPRERRRKTHAVVRDGRDWRLVRRRFDCGW
jgi:hypothetical protein